MIKRDWLSKMLAVFGSVLVWFPLVATVVMMGRDEVGNVRIDWLMPAELFPVAIVGAGLLLWAALHAHARRGLVAWGIGAMLAAIVVGMAITVLTGLASGAVQPENAPVAWGAAIAMIVAYSAAMAEIGVAGVLLVGDLFKSEAGTGNAPLPTA